jgi:hypothetical protein
LNRQAGWASKALSRGDVPEDLFKAYSNLLGIQSTFEGDLDKTLHLAPIILREGALTQTQLTTTTRKQGVASKLLHLSALDDIPNHIPWMRTLAALHPSLDAIANKFNLPLQSLDRFMQSAKVMEWRVLSKLKSAEFYVWKQIPDTLRTGLVGKRMSELVYWMLTDQVQKPKHAAALGRNIIPETITTKQGEHVLVNKEMVNEIQKLAPNVSREDIAHWAQTLHDDHRTIYNWFARSGLIAPDQYHMKYAPLIRLYQSSPNRAKVPFTGWIAGLVAKKNLHGELKDAQDLAVALNKSGEMRGLLELADAMHDVNSRGHIEGESPGSMEYIRAHDEAFIDEASRVTDIREATDTYIRKAVQRLVFRDKVPAVAGLLDHVLSHLPEASDRKAMKTIFRNYLDSMVGIPDAGTVRWSNLPAMPRPWAEGVANATRGLYTNYNRLAKLLHIPLAQLPDVEKIPEKSAYDVLQATVGGTYALTLGLPFNMTSPLQNITQLNLAIPAIGFKRYLMGVAWMLSPSHKDLVKEVMGRDLRLETKGFDFPDPKGLTHKWGLTTKAMMSLFRLSDNITVVGTAMGGIVAWKELEPYLKESPTGETLPDQAILKTLFAGGVPKVDDKAVMRGDPAFRKVISKSAALEVIRLIRQGHPEEAKDFYLRYIVALSQWRYGPGGQTGLLSKDPLIKAAGMFLTWPINGLDFHHRMFHSGPMMFRYIESHLSNALTCAALSQVSGVKGFRWYGIGTIPAEMAPSSPLLKILQDVYGLIHTTGEAFQADLPFGGATEADKEWIQKNHDEFLSDLYNQMGL